MSNVTSLEDARRAGALVPVAEPSSDLPPEHIHPRTIADMSDTEVDAYLVALRDRRMTMAAFIREQEAAKAAVASAAALQKIEKKAAQCKRAQEKVEAAIEKLEELIHQLRALRIQYE